MFKKLFKFIIVALLLAIVVLGSIYFYIQSQIEKPLSTNQNEILFSIAPGQSVSQIAVDLEKEGIIRNAFYFQFYVWQKKISSRLQAGEYILRPNMTIPQITEIISQGEIAPREIWITIQEGLTLKEIEEKFVNIGLAKRGQLLNYKFKEIPLSVRGGSASGGNSSGSTKLTTGFTEGEIPLFVKGEGGFLDFLSDKPRGINLEGYLFPDTYKFYKTANTDDIIFKMLKNFDQKLTAEMRQDIKRQKPPFKNGESLTIFDVTRLASIIQKEVREAEDMKKVAGIFYNRLNIGMNLEADSTITYLTGKREAQATFQDLQIDSFYNTYRYKGLPPGPISNPGLEAIKAAIYPEKTDYWYFLTTPEGKVIYSRTYQEHLKNKAKYLSK